ncbi:MAG TPA: DUF2845 domain-containing protein [Polyangiaceae bacterium]|nr:DUF2845 domain-containing protein [Polyangiaceae bacterium]
MSGGSMLRRISALAALAAIGLPTTPARADGMQCRDRLVSSGDTLYQVRATCGEPDDASHRIEYRTVRVRRPGACVEENGRRRCDTEVEQTIEVVIDEWVYDFGKNRFLEFLYFEQGKLVRVTEGSYGHKKEE